jgi:hypothetical protein
MNLWSGIGLKIKKIDARVNIGPNFRYSKTAEVFNNQINYSKVLSAGFNFWLSKSKDKVYDISLGNDFSYNYNKTSQSTSSAHYYTNRVSLDATVYVRKTWSLNSDYELYIQQKTQQLTAGLTNQFWNLKLQKTFKKDEFTMYLLVRDVLNQNIGIDRNFSSNTFTEVRNDRLKRYFLIGLTWNFKNSGAQAK